MGHNFVHCTWPILAKERVSYILKMLFWLHFCNISSLSLRHWQTIKFDKKHDRTTILFSKVIEKSSAKQVLPTFPRSMAKFQHPFNICRVFMGWNMCVKVYIFKLINEKGDCSYFYWHWTSQLTTRGRDRSVGSTSGSNSQLGQNTVTWVLVLGAPALFTRCGLQQVTFGADTLKTECISPCGGEIENRSKRNPLFLRVTLGVFSPGTIFLNTSNDNKYCLKNNKNDKNNEYIFQCNYMYTQNNSIENMT